MSTLKVDTIKSDTTPTLTVSDGLSVSGVTTMTNTLNVDSGSSGMIDFGDITSGYGRLYADSTGTFIGSKSNDPLILRTNHTEVARLDTSGRLLLTSTTSRSIWGANPQLQIEKLDSNAALTVVRNQNNAGGPWLALCKSRGTSNGAVTIIQDGDSLGSINWFGADGVDLANVSAEIRAEIDGTPGENDVPGRLIFKTTADGAASATERLRIDSSGNMGLGESSISPVGGTYKAFDIAYKGTGLSGRTDNPTFNLRSNIYYNGSAWKYGEGNTTAGVLNIGGGQIHFYHAASGSAGATATLNEVFNINDDGTMLWGTSNTGNLTAGGVKVQTTATNGEAIALNLRNPDVTAAANAAVSIDFNMDRSPSGGIHFRAGTIRCKKEQNWTTSASTVDSRLEFYCCENESHVERLRITSDGSVFHYNLTGNASSGSNVKLSNSDWELRYDTSSQLLKTNIAALTKYGIDTVKKLKPSTFTPQEYNKDGTITVGDESLIGFIADEMVEEVPEVVQIYPKSSLTKNEEDTELVPAAISYDKLTVVLTKALQEAIAKIETLETKVAALESA